MAIEATLYQKDDNQKVRCNLCSHRCIIKEGARGLCGVRENREGTLFSLVYNKLTARNADPIEKKPLFHFLPGTISYSVATVGCNFKCLFCQNADISQMPRDHSRIWGEDYTPEMIVEDAVRTGCASIAYTYTEPTIYYELARDTARLAAKKGIKNVFVSNGYMTEECLNDISPDLHGANIDLKAFRNDFYKQQCGAKLDPVLMTLERLKRMGVWLEVTTLLIPGLNDSKEELEGLAGFLAGLDVDIPWHISRFHPTYRMMENRPTPPETIHRARDIGYEAGLLYVYTGNLPGDSGETTRCHACNGTLIERFGFYVKMNHVHKGRCPHCGVDVPGVWE